MVIGFTTAPVPLWSSDGRHLLIIGLSPDVHGKDPGDNIRETLSSLNEATANMADDTEALKHGFLFRGIFKRRGYIPSPGSLRRKIEGTKPRGIPKIRECGYPKATSSNQGPNLKCAMPYPKAQPASSEAPLIEEPTVKAPSRLLRLTARAQTRSRSAVTIEVPEPPLARIHRLWQVRSPLPE